MTKLDRLAVFAVCYVRAYARRRLFLVKEYSDVISDFPSVEAAVKEGLKVARRRGY